MFEELKEEVCRANLELASRGCVLQSWGSASGIDRQQGAVVIKPVDVGCENLKPEHHVVVALDTGKVIEGALKPASDTATHLELYRAFPQLGGIVHTHSLHATAWAQAGRSIPCYGTSHADYWYGEILCTRLLGRGEVTGDYEANTGKVIVEVLQKRRLDPLQHPGVLVASHGPFVWGANPREAVNNAVALEFIARLASETLRLNLNTRPIEPVLLDRHFLRRHSPKGSDGQK